MRLGAQGRATLTGCAMAVHVFEGQLREGSFFCTGYVHICGLGEACASSWSVTESLEGCVCIAAVPA